MNNQSILNAVELLLLSLTIAVIVGIFARQRRMPYTVGLVLVGLLIVLGYPTIRQLEGLPFLGNMLSLLDELIHLNDILVRQIILGLMLPPIIFEAAFHLHFDDLRRDVGPIILFAIPGVIFTTLLAGGVVSWGIEIDFATAAVFGALIAATDPVAVVALFKALGVPRRLRVLLEGESLLNDGTAIVVFGMALSVSNGETLQLSSGIIDFVITVGGGLLIGIVYGWVISAIVQRLDDYLIETALIFILAYSAYITAENANVSGVLAVVAAGLLSGNIGLQSMSATSRIVVENFWEFTAFIANSLVFLLIGFVVDPSILWANKWIILLAILAVLAARAVVVYGFSAIVRNIPFRWQIVLHWGGLRGAITLALALSLTNDDLRAMAFGVVIFTLLVQGTSMGPIVRKLNLSKRSLEGESYQRKKAQTLSTRRGKLRLETLYREGIISDHTRKSIEPILENHIEELASAIREILLTEPNVAAEELDAAWREVLRAQRTALNELFADGAITEEYFWEMVSSVDTALQSEEINWMELEDLKAGLNIEEGDEKK